MTDHIPTQMAAYGLSPRRLIPAKTETPHLDKLRAEQARRPGETDEQYSDRRTDEWR